MQDSSGSGEKNRPGIHAVDLDSNKFVQDETCYVAKVIVEKPIKRT